MVARLHLAGISILCCVASVVFTTVAFGDQPNEGSPLGSLVVPGVQVLDGSQQLQEQEEARLSNPEAVIAREVSRTAYENLNAAQAQHLAEETFPEVVDHPSGGPPTLPAGQTITAFPSNRAAQVNLGGGEHGVIESVAPIATTNASGQRVPIDLGLTEAGASFQPTTPSVPVSIPKRLSNGVQLAATGISLTPVTAEGAALGGSEGALLGASVLYANTQTDLDTLVKPTTGGFQADSLLRSVQSPEQLSFRVGLPAGASLAHAPNGSEAVQIVSEGAVLATIPAPSAQDAAGTAVPVSMSFAGDVLTLAVAVRSGEYRYPVEVDPEVRDSELSAEPYTTNWRYEHEGAQFWAFDEDNPGWVEYVDAVHTKNEWGALEYPTQGESHIGTFYSETSATDGSTIEDKLEIFNSSKSAEAQEVLPSSYSATAHTLSASGSANANIAQYRQTATGNGSGYTGEGGTNKALHAWVGITQSASPTVTFDTTDPTVDGGKSNVLYTHGWLGPNSSSAYEIKSSDPGIGISGWLFSAPGWSAETNLLTGKLSCYGVQCPPQENLGLGYEYAGHKLPDGEDTVEMKVWDAVGLNATAVSPAKIKVDGTPPHSITLTGLPSGNVFGDGQYELKASATDGSGSTPSSGIASLALSIDGVRIGNPSGTCSPGPCTATSGEWTLNGHSYAGGQHTLTVTATDNAGNVATENYTVTMHHATPVGVGPGSVNPVSGELSLVATDVSASAAGASLTVGRSYSSRHLTAGAESPLGPQWDMSVGGEASLTKVASTGSMVLTAANGQQTAFTSKGAGEYGSPAGDTSLSLKEKTVGSAHDFVLTDSSTGSATTLAAPTGSSGGIWVPSIQEGTTATNTVAYAFQTTSKGVTEPTEALAPVPAGVSCSPTLTKGCRALTFSYATSTTATGEAPSQWGEYEGRLAKVSFTAWNPSTSAMSTVVVAQYSYDKLGRLRAEWNPQISPALKTTYGYDGEGHVTALSPAGQQPWLLAYGTAPGDVSAGRLLSATRPSASTALGSGEAPANSVVPTLSSSSATVGVKLSVAGNGTWSKSPLAYSYQWQDCNSTGEACVAIGGAVNQSYYPAKSDEGHTLRAQVIAVNSGGSTVAVSAATGLVASGTPSSALPAPPNPGSNAVWTIDYQVPVSGSGAPYAMGSTEVAAWGQTDIPAEATAVFPPDEPMGWPAENYKRATVYYRDGSSHTVNVVSPGGATSTSEYNAADDVVRTLSADNRAAALVEGSKSAEASKLLDTESSYSSDGTELLSTLGPQHNVQLASGSQVKARHHTVYSYDEGAPIEGGPYRLVTKMTEGAKTSNGEEELRSTETLYGGQEGLGWTLRKPTSVITDPKGLRVARTTLYEPTTGNVSETRMPAAGSEGMSFVKDLGSEGSGEGKFKRPWGIAFASNGDMYVSDSENNLIEEFNSSGGFLRQFGKEGTGKLSFPTGIAVDSHGDVWVTDTFHGRLVEFSSTGEYLKTVGASGSENGQFSEPEGIAFDAAGHMWVADTGNSRIQEFSASGEYLNKLGTEGTGKLSEPAGIAIDSHGNIWVSDTGHSRVVEFSPSGAYLNQLGKSGSENGQLNWPQGLAIDSQGHIWVADADNNRVQEFTPAGSYIAQFGSYGTESSQFRRPHGIAFEAHGDAWVTDWENHRLQEWAPPTGIPSSAHETQTIYYSSEANPQYPACGGHPEWASLACQTQPAKQPGTSGLPNLPVTTYTYNYWDEPEKTTETVGSTTRTKTVTYDAAGRLKTAAVTSAADTALPTVTDEYSSETGALTVQSTTSEGKTRKLTSVYNSLGQLTSYTDADENTSTYNYDIDGRTEKINDGKGIQTYTYDPTTGDLTKLVDSAAGTFTATYDADGNILTEGYPDGLTAYYTYDSTDKPIGLEYVKTTHCTSSCTWFKDTVVPSIYGQWISQVSTLSNQAYTYDKAGRLTQVQDTPAGKGCTTHLYAFDADTNRKSLTSREPGTGGACATEGGAVENHSYDEADRLTDTGIAYDTFGNTTKLPAADAGGSELVSSFYVDNQLASQEQNGETIGYQLDPAGRPRETVSTGKYASTVTSHYSGDGGTPAWTTNSSGEWTRDIRGIEGGLVATQSNSETPVLQLTNLHGDIIATAYLSETATALASTGDTTEFGVPRTSLPPKYSWLGSLEVPTELPSGVIAMGARSYVPQLGRFLQDDPVPGGSANAYTYTFGDPVNTSDPSGAYVETPSWAREYNNEQAVDATEAVRRAAEEAAARIAAEEAAQRAAALAAETGGPAFAFGEEEEWFEEEEYWEEEGEYEYAANHSGPESGKEERHIEAGVLYQSLGGEATANGTTRSTMPLCEAVAEGPCARLVPDDHSPNVQSECNRTGQDCGRRRSRPSRNEGPRVVGNICIFNWWNPVGWVCGAAAAGKAAYEAANK
jgi:RHS repeat-associated protein